MKIRLNTTETTKKAKKCEKNIENAITSWHDNSCYVWFSWRYQVLPASFFRLIFI